MSIYVQGNIFISTYSQNTNHSQSKEKSTVATENSTRNRIGVDISTINPVDFAGHENYTKEQAISRAWSSQNSISLEDLQSGKIKTLPSVISPPDFVTSLEQGTISPKVNFSFDRLDFNAKSIDTLQQSVDYIASRYAVMKEYVSSNFSGEIQSSNLKTLNDMFYSAKEGLVQDLIDQVGSFFEEYGVSDIKEDIYQSVFTAADTKAEAYSAYIQSNKNYAGINGTKDEWLKTDSAYMASELRKAAKGEIPKTTEQADTYTMDELEKMHAFVKEMKDYMFQISGSANRINVTGNEEEIGMQLSEVVLKGKMFNQYANVSEKVQNAISQSIDQFLVKSVEHIKKFVEDQITNKGNRITSAMRRAYTAIDEEAIWNVIDVVKDTYECSGDFYKSFLEGAMYAYNKQDEKIETGQAEGIYRYSFNGHRNVYWSNFFKSSDHTTSSWGISPLEKLNTEYLKKESGMESFLSSWNRFANQIAANHSAALSANYFSYFA